MINSDKGDDVLSVSFAHDFPYGDVPDAGGKLLVVVEDKYPWVDISLNKENRLGCFINEQRSFSQYIAY